MKFRKKYIVILIAILLVIGGAIFIYINTNKPAPPKDPLSKDDSAENWNGEQDLYKPQSEVPMIEIPGITSLVFAPDTKNQKVNFYNPENNNCLMRMTLFVADKQYWQSGFCEPGKGYYDIELSEPIQTGDYDAYLLVECFKEDSTQLNGARVQFNLEVR